MLAAAIRTHKNTGAGVCQVSVWLGVHVLHAFIDEVEVDVVTSLDSCLGKSSDCRGTFVRRRQGQEETNFTLHRVNPQEFILNIQ